MKLVTIVTGVLGGLALAVASAAPAAAAVPPRGTVVEGQSLPGVALGATRQQAVAAYGAPAYCLFTGRAVCTWQLGNGTVSLDFTRADGGPPAGTGRDRVASAQWTGLPGWRTTAGVTTTSALAHPESVPAAYPHAGVYRFSDGHLRLVIDFHVGIEVQWVPGTSPGQYLVVMETLAVSS
jgi:hypothetical protein